MTENELNKLLRDVSEIKDELKKLKDLLEDIFVSDKEYRVWQ